MEKIDQKKEALDSILKSLMVDDDLHLVFLEQKKVSEPDTDVDAYFFKMKSLQTGEEMGGINIRAGYTENMVNFRGNIGYAVAEKYRGHRYSARSCVLLIPVIKALGLNPIWLTCNMDNEASKRSIESIGARFVDTTVIPESSP
jgi:predicted acetyltransferase